MAVTYTAQSPYQDPAYLAFLRQQGVQESDLVGEAAYRIAGLQRQRARQLPRFDDRMREEPERISDDFENRGFLRSGANMVAQARSRRDILRDRGDFEAGIGDSISDLNRTAAMGVADLRRQRAEEELNARSRVALAGAEAGYR